MEGGVVRRNDYDAGKASCEFLINSNKMITSAYVLQECAPDALMTPSSRNWGSEALRACIANHNSCHVPSLCR